MIIILYKKKFSSEIYLHEEGSRNAANPAERCLIAGLVCGCSATKKRNSK
jgi:hypothetical protein